MKILLIRHAEAIDYETETVRNDEWRFITPKGRKTSLSVFKKLKDEFFTLEKIYSSPHIRSVQTAEILATYLKFKFDVEVVNELSPDSPVEKVVDLIKRNSIFQTVALVGHDPMMSNLVNVLSGGKVTDLQMKKSGVACIEYDVKAQKGEFQWYLNPKTLEKVQG
ncbi:MAG: phosphohistidine phosphatase SixA [Ignavibacteria bacterium]|nr:phosphohistidine phosphatase SixA [Ignavibacteria bacterium]